MKPRTPIWRESCFYPSPWRFNYNISTGNVTAAASESEGCQSCTEGYYCSGTGNTPVTRQICPAGYYCPTGSSLPTACAAGLYNSLLGSWSKDDCTGEGSASFFLHLGLFEAHVSRTVQRKTSFLHALDPRVTGQYCPMLLTLEQ